MQTDISQRRMALTAGLALLGMAVLAPIAEFGVLKALVVPGDAAVTFSNLVGSQGIFRGAIAALLAVIILDFIVAWAFYVLLRPVNETLALLVVWLRVAFAAIYAAALIGLFDAAQLLSSDAAATSAQIPSLVAASITSFDNGWDLALAVFGAHLVGLGALLFRGALVPRWIGLLVMVAGVGYLADTFGRILVPDYTITVSLVTFLGEALLIPWLLWKGVKGLPSSWRLHEVAVTPTVAAATRP
jgi:hypothetical protein